MDKKEKHGFLTVDYGTSKKIFDSSGILKSCTLIKGNNLEVMKNFPPGCVDLIYMDPPFFTKRRQSLRGKRVYKEEEEELSFDDVWGGQEAYLLWVKPRLIECKRVLRNTGSFYLHCDWHASHLLRTLLDEVFGPQQFRSEVVWYYKRWTNNFRSFQHSHELIYLYSKSDEYKFNVQYEDYSFTTNIDQIWQKRVRDEKGRCTYARANDKSLPLDKRKKGVPLRDVWEIPYLNPKAKERTGYPTQKPVELLLRIIRASSEEGDVILDPTCGSGTTLLAAKMLGRRWIGIDNNQDAIRISEGRLRDKIESVVTIDHHAPYRVSQFLKLSRYEKINHLAELLSMNIVQRSENIDGFLKNAGRWNNVAVRYIENEDVRTAIKSFVSASLKRHCDLGIVILPKTDEQEKKALRKSLADDIKLHVVGYEDLLKKDFIRGILFNESS